jgi:predicted DNA-binding transcriptional regulator AlpA
MPEEKSKPDHRKAVGEGGDEGLVKNKTANAAQRLRTAREAAEFLQLSESWLAKARIRGDGPPYVKIGRSIRYSEGALLQWMRLHQRLSTREG